MSENQNETAPEQPAIADEAAFCQVIGVNPGLVQRGSIGITFQSGQPVVSMTIMMPVSAQTLATAFTAAAPKPEPPARKQPADRRPAKKAAPRAKRQA